MSLDVYLELPERAPGRPEPPTGERIYVRRDGATVEVSRAEWDEMYPGREPVVMLPNEDDDGRTVYSANITHNLGKMAREAGLYEALWAPEEIEVTTAAQLIPLLRDGLAILQSDRERLEAFNPENGWGDYDGLARFTANYLAACERWPEATVRTWR